MEQKRINIFIFVIVLYINTIASFTCKRLSFLSSRPRMNSIIDNYRNFNKDSKLNNLHMQLEIFNNELNQENKSNNISSKERIKLIGLSSSNLVKNCVGAGVFSLNSRVLSISTNSNIIYPSSIVVLIMALWASYNFYMIGETCRLTNTNNYADAWKESISSKTSWIIQSVTVIAPIVSCLANIIVLTDILALAFRYFGISPQIYNNRNLVITILSTFILFPISISKDLSGLKNISIFGIFGHLIAMATIGYRIIDKSYLKGGKFYQDFIIENPILNTSIKYNYLNWFVLASLLSYCFVTHYNAPRYYNEISEKDSNPKTFILVSLISYITAALIYIGTIALSISLFGIRTKSFALNSFAPLDPLGTIARLTFGISVLASFPLIFLSIRTFFINKLISIFGINKQINIINVTSLLLFFISLLATKFKDIGFVGSLAGGLFGCAMMFIFPPIMYTGALIKQAKLNGLKVSYWKVFMNGFLTILGASLGLIGTGNNIMKILKR